MTLEVISINNNEIFSQERYKLNEQQPNLYSSFHNIELLDLTIAYK